MPRRQRILVADGSQYFKAALWRKLIPETEFQIVGLAGNLGETLKMALALSPDVVLIDLSHSKTCGLQTVVALHSVDPRVPIITFMPIASPEYARASFAAGASACLTKADVADMLAQTLRQVIHPDPLALAVS